MKEISYLRSVYDVSRCANNDGFKWEGNLIYNFRRDCPHFVINCWYNLASDNEGNDKAHILWKVGPSQENLPLLHLESLTRGVDVSNSQLVNQHHLMLLHLNLLLLLFHGDFLPAIRFSLVFDEGFVGQGGQEDTSSSSEGDTVPKLLVRRVEKGGTTSKRRHFFSAERFLL